MNLREMDGLERAMRIYGSAPKYETSLLLRQHRALVEMCRRLMKDPGAKHDIMGFLESIGE